jgi:hypothetical protein
MGEYCGSRQRAACETSPFLFLFYISQALIQQILHPIMAAIECDAWHDHRNLPTPNMASDALKLQRPTYKENKPWRKWGPCSNQCLNWRQCEWTCVLDTGSGGKDSFLRCEAGYRSSQQGQQSSIARLWQKQVVIGSAFIVWLEISIQNAIYT